MKASQSDSSAPSPSRRIDLHALVLPDGNPSILGGPRSTIEGWAGSETPCHVLTAPGGQTAEFASERGLSVKHVQFPPDPSDGGAFWLRLLKLIWWLVAGVRTLKEYGSVEVELNHLLELGPAARLYRKHLIVSCRDFPESRPRGLRRVLYRLPTAMYAINPEICDWISENAGRHDVRWIPLPVLQSSPTFDMADEEPEPRLAIIGLLSRKKGQLDFLLKVFPKLPAKWRLDLIGAAGWDAEYVKACRAAAARYPGRVRFWGHVEDWLGRPDRFVVVINSQNEGGPRVAVEALARGLPVVMRPFLGHKVFAGWPQTTVVRRDEDWPAVLERALTHRPSGKELRELEALLRPFRVATVARQLHEFRSGLVS